MISASLSSELMSVTPGVSLFCGADVTCVFPALTPLVVVVAPIDRPRELLPVDNAATALREAVDNFFIPRICRVFLPVPHNAAMRDAGRGPLSVDQPVPYNVAMPSATSMRFPSGSLQWLCGDQLRTNRRLLAIETGTGLCRTLAQYDADIVAVSSDPATATVTHRVDGVNAVCATADSLPFSSESFDSVIIHQRFHELAPGLVLPQIARVLRPGGSLGLSWLVRDDTVPWVRRLAALLRTVDPTAMTGEYGTESISTLTQSPYFPDVETRTHRIWIPVTKGQLISMSLSRHAVARLDDQSKNDLTHRIEDLYDDSSGPVGELRLPYELQCWRGWVDHSKLSAPARTESPGFVIKI